MNNTSIVAKHNALVKFSVNKKAYNKTELKDVASGWEVVESTITDMIKTVKKGYAITGATYKNGYRNKANVTECNLIIFDFDNTKVVKDAEGKDVKIYDPQFLISDAIRNNFVSNCTILIYTSPSCKPDWQKFRLICKLPEPLNVADYEALYKLIIDRYLPHADPSCKEASRLFFGNTNAEFFELDTNNIVPIELIEEARENVKKQEFERQQIAENNRAIFEKKGSDDDLIFEALKYIPPRQPGTNTYDETISVAMAIYHHFGESRAIQIIEGWSPTSTDKNWNVPQKVKSFAKYSGNTVSIGTLFYVAQQYGFEFPDNDEMSRNLFLEIKPQIIALYGQFKGKALSASLSPLKEQYFSKYGNNDIWRQEIEALAKSLGKKAIYGSKIASKPQIEVTTDNEAIASSKNPDFKVGDFVAHHKQQNRKLEVVCYTTNYEDGDNGIKSGYYCKYWGLSTTDVFFLLEDHVVPYVAITDQPEIENSENIPENQEVVTTEVQEVVTTDVDRQLPDSDIVQNQETVEIENSENIPENHEKSDNQNIRGIIFKKTAREGLGKGKTVIRREWTAKTAQNYINYYHQGVLIPALSGRLDRSGVELGKLRLTSEPYQQTLSEMTKEDLIKEGLPTWTLERFYSEFFDGDNAKNVWVLEFEYFPNEQKQKFDDLQDQYRELTSEQREEIYTEIALNELYFNNEKPYVSIDGTLYQWCGTHYEPCIEIKERKRISRWLVNFSPKLALPEKIGHVFNWVITNLAIDPKTINPIGINLLNGVLIPSFDKNGKGSVTLEDHDPKNVYNYCAPIKYDPKVETTHFNRLMECLDPPERKIFLRTMALTFDLPYFKSKLGRPRALLLKGNGSNGKDALNICLKQIFGIDGGFVETSLGAFKNYDSGKKFSLAKLNGAVISWSSENVDNINIDKLGSLKAAISGEVIQCEFKGVDEKPFNPKCLFVFNCNEPPKFPSKQKAIESRWAILQFHKTYSTKPNKRKGELQADPRFRDDLEFIQTYLAPAMLNALVEEMKDLAINGIDFSPVDINLEELQEEESHLFSFCKDINLKQDVDLQIGVSELWELLKNWYLDNGILEIIPMEKGKDKRIWNDQANSYDKNVTGSNQVFKRFKKLFPTIRLKASDDRDQRGRSFIKGIGIFASTASQAHPEQDSASTNGSTVEANVEAKNRAPSECEAVEANNPIPSNELSKVKQMSFFEKTEYLKEILTTEDWEQLEMMFSLCGMLNHCAATHDLRSLSELRVTYPTVLIKMAHKRLPDSIKRKIKNMVKELDLIKVGDRVLLSGYADHPNNHFEVLAIIDDRVKVDLPVGEAKYFPISEVRKILENN